MATHKFDEAKYQEKKQSREALNQPHTPPTAVPDLRDRVYELEKVVGIETEQV